MDKPIKEKVWLFWRYKHFSFYPNKHITTGEGGMVVTDNEAIAKKCKELKPALFLKNDLCTKTLGGIIE